VGRTEGKKHLKDLGVDGRKMLKLLFKSCDEEAWTGSIWCRIEAGDGRL
jgi:hypothetical protein